MRAALAVTLFAVAASAHAQQYGNPYVARQSAFIAQTTGRVPGGARPAAPVGVSAPGVPSNRVKPFSSITRAPVVSPYLNLFREEAENAAPNYHLFVQPQLQQQQLIQTQQQQLLQLQGRLQQSAPQPRIAGGARYGDTRQYYSGWRR